MTYEEIEKQYEQVRAFAEEYFRDESLLLLRGSYKVTSIRGSIDADYTLRLHTEMDYLLYRVRAEFRVTLVEGVFKRRQIDCTVFLDPENKLVMGNSMTYRGMM